MSAPDVHLGGRRESWEQIALPAPDEHADLGSIEPGETAPVWHLHGTVFEDLGNWVRAASAWGPMEIAGHDVDAGDLDALEHDLLALLAAVRASRAATRPPRVGDRVRLTYGDGSGCEGTWEIDADGDPVLRLDDGTWHGHVAGQVMREIVRTASNGPAR